MPAVLPKAWTAVWLTACWLWLGKHKAAKHNQQTFQLQNLLPLSNCVSQRAGLRIPPLEKYPVMFCWHKGDQMPQDSHKLHTSPYSIPHLQNRTSELPHLTGHSRITTISNLRSSHLDILGLATSKQQKIF